MAAKDDLVDQLNKDLKNLTYEDLWRCQLEVTLRVIKEGADLKLIDNFSRQVLQHRKHLQVQDISFQPSLTPSLPYIVFLDIESVWEDQKKKDSERRYHHIFDIAICDLNGRQFNNLVRPLRKDLYGLDNTPDKKNDVYKQATPSFIEAWELIWNQVQAIAEDRDIVMLAHNGIDHDFKILRAEFQRNEMSVPDFFAADSMKIFSHLRFAFKGRESLITNFAGDNPPDNHTALADAHDLVRLAFAFMGAAELSYRSFATLCKENSVKFVLG